MDAVGGVDGESGLGLAVVLVLKDLPPLAESAWGATREVGCDLLPLIAVLCLEAYDEALLFICEGTFLDARHEVVLPAL